MTEIEEKVSEIEVSYKPAIGRRPIITSVLDAFNELVVFFPLNTIALQEKFVVMYLNKGKRVIGIYPLSIGGIAGTIADIKLILATALKTASSSIVLCHNHPSGNLTPSRADREVTEKIKQACSYFDIELIDHLIIAPNNEYLSMATEGLIN